MTTENNTKSRKERRKEERLAKKRKRGGGPAAAAPPSPRPSDTKREKEQSKPPSAAASAPKKKETNKKPKKDNSDTQKEKEKKSIKRLQEDDLYAHLDAETAAAMRRDDEEIAVLEAKLAADPKGKSRLNREYAKLEGYGDDFGDFLDGLDSMVHRVVAGVEGEEEDTSSSGDDDDGRPMDDFSTDDSDIEEEEVPMKDPAFDSLDDDDSVLDEMEAEGQLQDDESNSKKVENDKEESSCSDEDSDSDSDSEEITGDNEADHDHSATYRPTNGEDIYGNKIEDTGTTAQPKKYVPPHLRNRQEAPNDSNDKQIQKARQESLRIITRSLNSALNRLSEDTLVPVAQSLSQLYSSHPTADVNDCLWKNTQNACIDRGHQMTGLIPVYVAAMVGAHLLKGDAAQLGEFLIEKVVFDLWKELETARKTEKSHDDDDDDEEEEEPSVNKEACNSILILCYLYNFGVVHCSLLYDIIRNMIESFHEIDIELLLLILSHCGRTLRSDDPLALKEIVLLVQKTHLEKAQEHKGTVTSRGNFMMAAMQDLKNNKRRKQDQAFADKTAKLRKSLGQIKSGLAANSIGVRSSDSSLRISLQDILDVETKGRWWKVGASWVGNQHSVAKDPESQSNTKTERSAPESEFDGKLLKLAAKYRMNTDVRRSIFCIIMGSADYEDCFEKLVRAGMLKNRSERDTVRVLMEICGKEKAYNKFYSHLAQRICEYQMQCKFTFQLAFWDAFKQFDEMKPRKAANLAKLLFHLVVTANCLKLNVLKAIDMAAPEDLSETATIFLTIFLSSILEHYDDPGDVFRMFDGGISNRKSKPADDNDAIGNMDEGEALQASLTVFMVQVLKASPKYKKGSKYRTNLKAAIKACNTEDFF